MAGKGGVGEGRGGKGRESAARHANFCTRAQQLSCKTPGFLSLTPDSRTPGTAFAGPTARRRGGGEGEWGEVVNGGIKRGKGGNEHEIEAGTRREQEMG